MPHHTEIDADGVEWDVVQIPALIAHGNRMLMLKPQGCWELDNDDEELAWARRALRGHSRCLNGHEESMASMFHYDKYGFTRSVRKVRVTPQDPDRHYSPVTVHGVDIEEGHEVQTRQEIGVQPGSLPDVPLDSGGLPLPDEVRGTRRTDRRPSWNIRRPDEMLRGYREQMAADLDSYNMIRDMLRATYIQSAPLMDMELPVTESSIQDMATDDSERF